MKRTPSTARTLGALAALALVSLCGSARAGVVWVTERQRGAETTTATVSLEGDNLRMESGRGEVMLYNAATKKMTLIRTAQQTYHELGPDDMKRIGAQMDAARAQMQARMANMPPEQRKMVEQMMAQQGRPAPGAPAVKEPEWTFQAAGQKKTINGFPCEVYKVLEGAAQREEDCLSPWGKALVTREDLSALLRFAESITSMMGEMGGPMRGQVGAAMTRVGKFPGFPVQRVLPGRDGGPAETETLKQLERKSLPASLFTVPAGFKRAEMPQMPMMGPGGRGPHGPHGGPGAHPGAPGGAVPAR